MISVCVITKNEKQNIKKCVLAIERVFKGLSEIVVVDTGSVDGTRELLENLKNQIASLHVFDYIWGEDFSAAKNYAISMASNDLVMIVDSDEFLEQSIQINDVVACIESHPNQVGRIKRRNIFSSNGRKQENIEWINRIFSRNFFEYKGRIHEQVVAKDGSVYDTYKVPLSMVHTGYDLPEAQRKEKAKRNIVLLLAELEQLLSAIHCADILELENVKPEEGTELSQIPYVLYQLGKGYYMNQDYECACDYFAKGLLFDLNPKLEYVIDMVETYGYALINSGQADKALYFENIYDVFGNTADFKFLMGIIYMNNARYDNAVEEFLKATEMKECRMAGVNSYAAFYNIGVIYECLDKKEKAKVYYMKAGDYEPARKRLYEMG